MFQHQSVASIKSPFWSSWLAQLGMWDGAAHCLWHLSPMPTPTPVLYTSFRAKKGRAEAVPASGTSDPLTAALDVGPWLRTPLPRSCPRRGFKPHTKGNVALNGSWWWRLWGCRVWAPAHGLRDWSRERKTKGTAVKGGIGIYIYIFNFILNQNTAAVCKR